MANLWPEKFQVGNKPAAKGLLEEQARLLPKLTGDMVYAEISELRVLEGAATGLEGDFRYRFDLKSKFLENYRFMVFAFAHDISLYPIKFVLDEKIGKELGLEKNPYYGYMQTIISPGDIEPFIGAVFKSDRMSDVIGSIMQLSK